MQTATIKADYTITVPPGSTVSPTAAATALSAATPASLTSVLTSSLTALGSNYTPTVASTSVVPVTTTTNKSNTVSFAGYERPQALVCLASLLVPLTWSKM